VFTKHRAAGAGLLALLSAALLGCQASDAPAPEKPAEDPALASSLQAPIMTDPDLAQQSNAGSALTGGGPPVMELPPIETGAEAIAAAKAEAAKLVGKAIASPPLSGGDAAAAVLAALTPAQLSSLVKLPSASCKGQLSYGASWSTRLPASLPIYPRGHLQEAAGSDKAGCHMRVVSFLTPVPAEDVVAFYNNRAKAAGMSIKLTQSDGVQVLEGSKAGLAMLARARRHSLGVSSIDLVVISAE
jgi:hypothetical protein